MHCLGWCHIMTPEEVYWLVNRDAYFMVYYHPYITGVIPIQCLHLGRLTWNLKTTQLKRKIIFQTIIFRFHVNLPGCILPLKKLCFTVGKSIFLPFFLQGKIVVFSLHRTVTLRRLAGPNSWYPNWFLLNSWVGDGCVFFFLGGGLKYPVNGWHPAPPEIYDNPIKNGISTTNLNWCRMSAINVRIHTQSIR